MLADVYEGSGNQAAAQETYEELARKYPWTQSAGRARFRLGILAYLDGDYASARRHFDHSRQAFRRAEQRTQSTYWAARAREAEGDSGSVAEAKRLFRQTHARDPFGYYGLLAAERADIDPWENLATGPEPTPIDAATEHRFATIELLLEAGLTEEAELVLNSILRSRPRRPEDLLGLSYELAERGFGEEAVLFGWRAHARLRGRWSVNVLRGIYPLTYSEILLAESRHHRVDPHLLAAVVRQESAFSPDVISRAGARGLLQIMPGTGRWWATRLGVRDYSDELLFHPETNVHLGAAFLSDLQRRYRELQISLAAYNAGPTRARRWVQSRAYRVDPEIFAERIPFSETRGYVRNIQTQLRIYRQLYTEFGTSEATD
jgi:soluble lytic murein transglycosylase